MPVGKDYRTLEASKAGDSKLSLAIVADDLTGACDAAVAFTGFDSAVRTGIDHIPICSAEIWATSTGSRDIDPGVARTKVRIAVMKILQDSERHIFKKVDSVFRGNTLVEIDETVETAKSDLVILCAAHPNLGRSMVAGRLFVRDGTHEGCVPIAEPLARMGCYCAQIPPGLSSGAAAEKMRTALANGTRVMLCDAVVSDDLKTAIRAARSVAKRPLWIGSGGLAWALADEFPGCQAEERVDRTGNVVFFIGSNHAATMSQVKYLQCVSDDSTEQGVIKDRYRLMPIAYGQREHEIRWMMRGVLPQETGCLFMTGGDTALSVCRALGIRALRLIREIAPGVPMAVAEGGAFDHVPVVLKSGAFGASSLMHDVIEMFRRKEVVI